MCFEQLYSCRQDTNLLEDGWWQSPALWRIPWLTRPRVILQLYQWHCAIYKGKEEQLANTGKTMTKILSPLKERRI